jgi:ribose-phosphate pyrophosphokinase
MIVPGAESQSLSAALATELDESLAQVDYRRFPDGELLVSLPDGAFEGDDPGADRAIVVASTTSPEAHVQLLQLQDAAREAGAEEIITVLPYMGYARQDRAFKAGQPVSARAVARAVSTGADRVLTVNPHESAVCDFFTVPAEQVDAAGRLAGPVPENLLDPLFLAPDDGALDIAETVRDAYGRGDVDYFEKHRDRDTGAIEMEPSELDAAERDVVIVDDIVATGSTMSEAIALLQDRGPDRVFVATVHGLLVENARTKLANAGVQATYATDTIEGPETTVSVAPAIAGHLE